MPLRNRSKSRPWARRIPRRLLRLPDLLPPRNPALVALAQALVAAVPPQALPRKMVLSRPSRSLLLVCWVPLVLPLACFEHSNVYMSGIRLHQDRDNMRCPMCSVSFILGPGSLWTIFFLRILLRPDNYHPMFSFFFMVYVFLFQPIPSPRLIYHSFLHTVMTVKLTMRMTWDIPHQEMTRYTGCTKPQHRRGGCSRYLSTDNDHGINTNCKDMLSVCKCPR